MANMKFSNGMHYSVGAVIERNGKYLLIDRAVTPFGFAGIAGHVDEGETEIETLKREVKEESGLEILSHELLFEEKVEKNRCVKGVETHYWHLFRCRVIGSIRNSSESKSISWYSKEEIKKLKLEPVWEYWLQKLNIID